MAYAKKVGNALSEAGIESVIDLDPEKRLGKSTTYGS